MARPGDFCPNAECDDYGKLQSEEQTNIIKFGKTKAGRQRHKCKTCNCTFVETKGTIFYGRRTPEEEIIDTLTLIAEDSRISSLARAKGHKEETIIDWTRAAGQHAERVEEVLLAEHKIKSPQPGWQYLQVVKQRENGRVVGVSLRVIFGGKDEVLKLLGTSTAYVERTHLTMRPFNSRKGTRCCM